MNDSLGSDGTRRSIMRGRSTTGFGVGAGFGGFTGFGSTGRCGLGKRACFTNRAASTASIGLPAIGQPERVCVTYADRHADKSAALKLFDAERNGRLAHTAPHKRTAREPDGTAVAALDFTCNQTQCALTAWRHRRKRR